MEERIRRIMEMERLLDLALADGGTEEIRQRLADYYFGPLWREDYEADEAGLLPKDLKRGVLSQDALYDLLCSPTE